MTEIEVRTPNKGGKEDVDNVMKASLLLEGSSKEKGYLEVLAVES